MSVRELSSIAIESGVSLFTGEGFCHVHAVGTEGTVVAGGQMTPAEVRSMALHWLRAAEAAEHDAAVVAELRETGLGDQNVAPFLTALRARRAGQ